MRLQLADLHPKRFFLDTWRALDEEAAAARGQSARSWDWRPVWALGACAVAMTVIYYFSNHAGLSATLRWLAGVEGSSFDDNPFLRIEYGVQWRELWGYAWWGLTRFACYVLAPVLIIKLAFRERVADFGLSLHGMFEHWIAYVFGFVVVLLCVIFVVAFVPEFRAYYPFYRQAGRSWLDLGLWEMIYLLNFFSLEFFFRGFLLNAMRPAIGSYAIFVMVVPYCMLHFGKPFLESLAAIIAGVFLGTLALKTRSIWAGALVHIAVALSMDVAVLVATGRIPRDLTP